MKKRHLSGAKSGKTRQNRVPSKTNPIHEWDRRLRQAGYIVLVPRKKYGIATRILATITVGIIIGMIVLAVYASTLYH